jgi:hypothetical protein
MERLRCLSSLISSRDRQCPDSRKDINPITTSRVSILTGTPNNLPCRLRKSSTECLRNPLQNNSTGGSLSINNIRNNPTNSNMPHRSSNSSTHLLRNLLNGVDLCDPVNMHRTGILLHRVPLRRTICRPEL